MNNNIPHTPKIINFIDPDDNIFVRVRKRKGHDYDEPPKPNEQTGPRRFPKKPINDEDEQD